MGKSSACSDWRGTVWLIALDMNNDSIAKMLVFKRDTSQADLAFENLLTSQQGHLILAIFNVLLCLAHYDPPRGILFGESYHDAD